MDENITKIVSYGIFGFLIVVGFSSMALFGYLQRQKSQNSPAESAEAPAVVLVMWGTVDRDHVAPLLDQLQSDRGYDDVLYVEKHIDAIENDYIRSVALNQQPPDLLLLESQEFSDLPSFVSLYRVPFEYLYRSLYEQSFTPASRVFIRPDGYEALPLFMDTMVLYYNENLRLQNNLRTLPTLWRHFSDETYEHITARYRDIGRSVIPLGSFGNYENAPYLFSALMLQAQHASGVKTDDLVDLYTSFSNPRSSVFTWSESFLAAQDMFSGGRLLFYPGFVSEYDDLRHVNPNIVVGVSPLPQISDAVDTIEVVPARLYGVSVLRRSATLSAALQLAMDLNNFVRVNPEHVFAQSSLLPAVRKFDVAADSTSAEKVFADSVFLGRTVPFSEKDRSSLAYVLRDIVLGVVDIHRGVRSIDQIFN